MIHVVATITAHPGQRAKVLDLAALQAHAVRAAHEGPCGEVKEFIAKRMIYVLAPAAGG